jgi:hypothetical protein
MGGLKNREIFFGSFACFQVRTRRSGRIKGAGGVLSVGGSLVFWKNGSNAWRVWVFGIGGLEKMNSPSWEGRWVFGLCREDLRFGLALMVLRIKGGWVVDDLWRISCVSSLISFCPHPERLFSIQFKIRVLLFVGKEKMFEGVYESVQAHAKGNKKKFGEALIVFGKEFLAAFVESGSDLF